MKTIFKIFSVILTFIAGAIIITFLITGIETNIETIIVSLAGAWLIAIIGATFTYVITEDE